MINKTKRIYWMMEERKRLNKLTEDVPSKQKELIEGLIKNASFISSMIKDIAENVDELVTAETKIDDISNQYSEIIDDDIDDEDGLTMNGLYHSLIKRHAEIMVIINGTLPKNRKRIKK